MNTEDAKGFAAEKRPPTRLPPPAPRLSCSFRGHASDRHVNRRESFCIYDKDVAAPCQSFRNDSYSSRAHNWTLGAVFKIIRCFVRGKPCSAKATEAEVAQFRGAAGYRRGQRRPSLVSISPAGHGKASNSFKDSAWRPPLQDKHQDYRKYPRCLSDMGSAARSITFSKSSHTARFERLLLLRSR